jgi:hypothetical protein
MLMPYTFEGSTGVLQNEALSAALRKAEERLSELTRKQTDPRKSTDPVVIEEPPPLRYKRAFEV